MHIEHSLAARAIVRALQAGYQKAAAISQATTLLRSQGFSKDYSAQVAAEMAELV